MSIGCYFDDDKMSSLSKAKMLSRNFFENATPRQKELLKMSDTESFGLSNDEKYERVRIQHYIDGINRVISLNENSIVPLLPAPDKVKQLPFKKWTPNDHNNRDY